ncbi:MAG: hypothetical protein QOJ06_3053 [Pseudonocardiales bacterium]|nr:hypothetical protein [Pseudonocardiales bacterium]
MIALLLAELPTDHRGRQPCCKQLENLPLTLSELQEGIGRDRSSRQPTEHPPGDAGRSASRDLGDGKAETGEHDDRGPLRAPVLVAAGHAHIMGAALPRCPGWICRHRQVTAFISSLRYSCRTTFSMTSSGR